MIVEEAIEKIKKEVSTWNYEELTEASFEEIVEDVLWNIEYQGMTLEEAFNCTNEKISDGNL